MYSFWKRQNSYIRSVKRKNYHAPAQKPTNSVFFSPKRKNCLTSIQKRKNSLRALSTRRKNSQTSLGRKNSQGSEQEAASVSWAELNRIYNER